MKKLIQTVAMAILTGFAFAQTNPTPWNFNTQGNYSFTSIVAASPTLPPSMAIHQMSDMPATLSSTAISDIPLPLAAGTAAQTNVRGYNTKGLGLRSSPVSASAGYQIGQLGEVVLALNTTGRTNVRVSFLAGTIDEGTGGSADFSLRCQYRLGHSGTWSEISGTPVEYATADVEDSVSFGPILLPSNIDNQPEVQIRWAFYKVSGAFVISNDRSHRGRLDNISITSLPIVTFPAMAEICPTTPAFNLTTATPSGGVYSGPGVSAGKFNPSVGQGVFPITYSFTDAFGMSNSAVRNFTVNYSGCVTQLNPGQCGTTLSSVDQNITWTGVPSAINYRVKINSTTSSFYVENTRNHGSNTYFKLTWIPGIKYGQSYDISIAAYVNGAWRPYGSNCNISTSSTIPTSSLTSSSVNLSTLDQSISFTGIPLATNYRLEISNAAQSFTTVNVRQNTVLNYKMSWVSGVQYGRTYNVRVSAYVDGAWRAYGPTCTVTTPSTIPSSQLTVCGQSVPTLSTVVSFNPVSGASNYRLEVASQTSTVVNYRPNNLTNWALSFVPGTQVNTPYSIRVAAYVGGVWGPYGQTCTLYCMGSLQRTNMFEESINEVIAINIYPNPNNGQFTIDLPQEADVIIMDALGKEVLNHRFSAGKQELGLENIENGIYFINAIMGEEKTIHKMIINK
jgi:hypothetical protein